MIHRTRCIHLSSRRKRALKALLLTAVACAAGCLLLVAGPLRAEPMTEAVTDAASARQMIARLEARALQERLALMAQEQTPLEARWGIKLQGIRRTAAGYALDLRYKVLDPEKATPLLHRSMNPNPYVIVERSGARLGVPFTDKAGSLRSSVSVGTQIKQGRDYVVLFANPGQHVKAGDRVTLVMGGLRVEHLKVQ